eukprot:scaffold81371_cov70-Phaeocystis_antarctica.AAC.1
MLVESASLKAWLVEELEPISDSDPSVLADYILVLLEKDQPDAALQQSCRETLLELLKDETEGFVDRLFDALHTDSYLFAGEAEEAEEAEEVEEAEEEDDAVMDDAATDDAVGISSERSLGRAAAAESDDDDDDDREQNYKRRRRPEKDEPAAEVPGGGRRDVPGPGEVPGAKQQRRSHAGGAPARPSGGPTARHHPAHHPAHHAAHHAPHHAPHHLCGPAHPHPQRHPPPMMGPGAVGPPPRGGGMVAHGMMGCRGPPLQHGCRPPLPHGYSPPGAAPRLPPGGMGGMGGMSGMGGMGGMPRMMPSPGMHAAYMQQPPGYGYGGCGGCGGCGGPVPQMGGAHAGHHAGGGPYGDPHLRHPHERGPPPRGQLPPRGPPHPTMGGLPPRAPHPMVHPHGAHPHGAHPHGAPPPRGAPPPQRMCSGGPPMGPRPGMMHMH